MLVLLLDDGSIFFFPASPTNLPIIKAGRCTLLQRRLDGVMDGEELVLPDTDLTEACSPPYYKGMLLGMRSI